MKCLCPFGFATFSSPYIQLERIEYQYLMRRLKCFTAVNNVGCCFVLYQCIINFFPISFFENYGSSFFIFQCLK